MEDQTGSTADSLSLHKPDLEESEPDKKAHITDRWSLQTTGTRSAPKIKHFLGSGVGEKIHEWEESESYLKQTKKIKNNQNKNCNLKHKLNQKVFSKIRYYLRNHQRSLLNFDNHVEEDVAQHDNSSQQLFTRYCGRNAGLRLDGTQG